MMFLSRMLKDSDIFHLFDLLVYSALDNKGLLIFHKPLPLFLLDLNAVIKVIREFSLQNKTRTSALKTLSCKKLKIKR